MNLESIPHEALTLGNLKHLQCRDNHIMFIPPDMGRMNRYPSTLNLRILNPKP